MELNEKGYYFAVLIFGLSAAISLQKAVRDKEEGIPVINKTKPSEEDEKLSTYGLVVFIYGQSWSSRPNN